MQHRDFLVGDTVCYRRRFLRSTGMVTGPIPFAKGTIRRLKPLGSLTVATIRWDVEGVPTKVLTANLAHPGTFRATGED